VTRGLAPVESVEIVILESFPVQVRAMVSGNLPDGCTDIDQISQQRQEDRFLISITTVRPAGMMCTEALVPYEETINLDVEGLLAGTYVVDVNGTTAEFELAVDNKRPDTGATTGKVTVNPANVGQVTVERDDAGTRLVVKGSLPDGCTKIAGHEMTVKGNRIVIELLTERPVDAICTQVIVFYEHEIPLDTGKLAPGAYTVDVNGMETTLEIK
jgi:inhibitor of cysteine peptidase